VVVNDPDSPAGVALRAAARDLARVSRSIVRRPLGLAVAAHQA
jgi:hypothetical protein